MVLPLPFGPADEVHEVQFCRLPQMVPFLPSQAFPDEPFYPPTPG